MAELLAYLARELVDDPDAVRVEPEERDGALVLVLHVAPGRRRQGDRPRRADRPRAADGRPRERRPRRAARAGRDRRVTGGGLVLVGRVGRPHGLDGSFFVEDASEDERWFELGRAAARRRRARSEVVVARRGAGGRPVIRLDRAGRARHGARGATRGAAADRRGRVLRLPARRPRGASRRAAVASAASSTVVPGVANDALELDGGLLLPLVGACVRDIDLEAGRILVAPGFSDPD